MSIALERFDHVVATFQPQRTDDLQNNAERFIGVRCIWHAAWEVTEEDGGPYVGQWAMCLDDPGVQIAYGSSFAWVPLCDLTDVVKIERAALAAHLDKLG